MPETLLGWLFTAIFAPIAGTLWKAWQDQIKRNEALQERRVDDEREHGKNRLGDARAYADALEAQVRTLERAVAMAENQGAGSDMLESCKQSLEAVHMETRAIKALLERLNHGDR